MKRKTFYVSADVYGSDLSCKAIAVFGYLCRCANAAGECFPSMNRIAENSHICRKTAQRAIAELTERGFISAEPSYMTTRTGKRRQQANQYHILRRVTRTRASENPVHAPRVPDAQEINNNSNSMIAVPSVGHNTADERLEGLIDGLNLHLYEDKPFAEAIEQTIRRMYTAESITVNGQVIGQGAVREVLSQLTIDHIDYIQAQIAGRLEEITNGQGYLVSCIYNAPADYMVKQRRAYGYRK